MQCNHKKKGKCCVKGCNNMMKSRGRCKICGQTKYKKHCRSHFTNGQKMPRLRGKKTTNAVRQKRKAIVKKRAKKREENNLTI